MGHRIQVGGHDVGPTFWAAYFTVDNCDVTAERAMSLGGHVCVPARDIPNIGRYARITSPSGITFHVITYAMAAP